MSDDDFDDIDTETDPNDDGYVRIRKDDLKKIRSAARSAGVAKKQIADLQREKAVRTAGIEGLSDRQIAVIAREAEGDESPENLRKIAEELGFQKPAPPSEEEQQTEAEAQQHSEAVAATSGGQPAAHQTTVTPQDAAAWGVDKRMRFLNQHPDLHELLLREQPVTLPAGFN